MYEANPSVHLDVLNAVEFLYFFHQSTDTGFFLKYICAYCPLNSIYSEDFSTQNDLLKSGPKSVQRDYSQPEIIFRQVPFQHKPLQEYSSVFNIWEGIHYECYLSSF